MTLAIVRVGTDRYKRQSQTKRVYQLELFSIGGRPKETTTPIDLSADHEIARQ